MLQVLNDSGQEIDAMQIEDLNEYYLKKKRVDGFILFQNQQDDGENEIFGELLQLLYFPLYAYHYTSIENPMDKAMVQLFGSQLIIFVIQLAFSL